MRKTIASLHSYCYRIIDSRLERKKAGGEMGGTKAGKDLLELFIDQGISREELLPVLLNFIVAGRDTTAQSLAWFFYEMWNTPSISPRSARRLCPCLDHRASSGQWTLKTIRSYRTSMPAFMKRSG